MSADYGIWGRYNDSLAGPPGTAFAQFFQDLLPRAARILEVGVGAGRLALPLARAGFRMSGIDSSEGMLALLKEADTTGLVNSWHADILDAEDLGTYDAVLMAYNVLSMMPSREAQARSVAAAARCIAAGGYLVVENAAPRAILSQLNPRGQTVGVQFQDGNVWLNVGRYFPEDERYLVRYLAFGGDAFVQRHGDLTLIAPEQLRELATQTGLDTAGLMQDWSGSPFTSRSDQYVMTFRRD